MTDQDPVAWLRAAIEARLELARKADTGNPWEADKHYDALWAVDFQPSAGMVPDGQQWQDVQVSGITDTGSYDAPRWVLAFAWHAQHIALNDPQDTIARCEAELAILDEHAAADFAAYGDRLCRRCRWDDDEPGRDDDAHHWVVYPCRTVNLLAGGYRHTPGYREEDWRPTP